MNLGRYWFNDSLFVDYQRADSLQIKMQIYFIFYPEVKF